MPEIDSLTDVIAATGALGAAAFGVVEALKALPSFASTGTRRVDVVLGAALVEVLTRIHGGRSAFDAIVQGAFAKSPDALGDALKKGLRLALLDETQAAAVMQGLGRPKHAEAFVADLDLLREPETKENAVERSAAREHVAQIQMLLDTRVEAAVAAADRAWAASMRAWAMLVAVVAGVAVGYLSPPEGMTPEEAAGYGLLVGLAAVPVAPLSKELISLVSSARSALSGRPRS